MAKAPDAGQWLWIEELLERGDPAFVDELRKVCDAEALGTFASRWYDDRRPASRRLLLEYLERPLNAYRHEPLVKRLFKRAEAAGDDVIMARFVVLFDRSVRRVQRRRPYFESRDGLSREEATNQAMLWRDLGYEYVNMWEDWRGRFRVWGTRFEPRIVTPRDTIMPRDKPAESRSPWTGHVRTCPDWVLKLRLDPGTFRKVAQVPQEYRKRLARFRLFSTPTRNYLRRRAWRYFRKLGQQNPDRYIAAISEALLCYKDDDVADGLALLDNWGLIHILFHDSPVLVSKANGWRVADGRSLAELEPAPIFAPLWRSAPRALLDLAIRGRSRTVRRWAMQTIGKNPTALASVTTLEELLGLLSHDDADVVALASGLLGDAPGLGELPAERWVALAESANPAGLEVLCELMRRHLSPGRLTLAQAVKLAASRPVPVARVGLDCLRTRTVHADEECQLLLGLAEAECAPLRREIVAWARKALAETGKSRPEWILEFLDSRHADVRAEGWAWFREDLRSRDDVDLWRRILETPYDDVRLALVSELESRVGGRDPASAATLELDPELLRFLWASVLLNIERGGRAKPSVLRMVLGRFERRPNELPELLPILAVALRSVRGPEWRSGLAAVVQLVERNADAAAAVRAAFPELQWA